MRVWRLTRPEFAPGLDGVGARREGGRWNNPGNAVVYTASSLSLATLEVFVHLPASMRRADKLPALTAVEVELPGDHSVETLDMFDPDWSIRDFRAFSDDWITRAASLCLNVPSLIIPQERNVLINPGHPEMANVVVRQTQPFRLDGRLAAD